MTAIDSSAPPPAELLGHPAGEDLWVFAYGSLIWNPGFAYLEAHSALLRGFHRKFCIASEHYRGTPERPGLVLGLDRGGTCRGVALRVAAEAAEEVLDYLWRRELLGNVYRPRRVLVDLADRRVPACAFVVDRASSYYRGALTEEEAAAVIVASEGSNGTNWEYLAHTHAHLVDLGIVDPKLKSLVGRVRRMLFEESKQGNPSNYPASRT
jgi:glutathione-specific gamma-glutamylcyclotransferase